MNIAMGVAGIAFLAVLGTIVVHVVTTRRHPSPMDHRFAWLMATPWRRQALRHSLPDLGIRPGMTVLEVGCGPGASTELAAREAGPGGAMHAVDVNPEMVARARGWLRRRGVEGVRVSQGDATAIPYPDATFDLVFMITVLGEVPAPDRAVAEITRVLKPGGTFAITEHLLDPHFVPAARLERLCAGAGLTVAGGSANPIVYSKRYSKPASGVAAAPPAQVAAAPAAATTAATTGGPA